MTKLPKIDQSYLNELLLELLNIPSPTGYTDQIINYLEDKLKAFPDLILHRTAKGTLAANWTTTQNYPPGLNCPCRYPGCDGERDQSNGRLTLTQLGSYAWNTIEGEGCTVFANSSGDPVRGSILLNKASSHAFGQRGWKYRAL